MGPEGAVDSLLNYEQIANSALAPFDESGIWDESMFPDVDDYMNFGAGLARLDFQVCRDVNIVRRHFGGLIV